MGLGSFVGKVLDGVAGKAGTWASRLLTKGGNELAQETLEAGGKKIAQETLEAGAKETAKKGFLSGPLKGFAKKAGIATGVVTAGNTFNRMGNGENPVGAAVGGVGDTFGMFRNIVGGATGAVGAVSYVAQGASGLFGVLGDVVKTIASFVKENPLVGVVGGVGAAMMFLGGGGIGKLALLAAGAGVAAVMASGKGGNVLDSFSNAFLGKGSDDVSASVASGAEQGVAKALPEQAFVEAPRELGDEPSLSQELAMA